MDVLPYHFRILRCFGFWYQPDESYKVLKKVHTIVMSGFIFYYTLVQLIATVMFRENVQVFIKCLSVSLTYVCFIYKLINFQLQFSNLNDLLNIFRMEICKPLTAQENKILAKYENLSTKLLKYYFVLVELSGVGLSMMPLLRKEYHDNVLPYKIYSPFDLTDTTTYTLTYIFEVVINAISILLHNILDGVVFTLLYLISGQLELYCYRIQTWNENTDKLQRKKSLEYLVTHHNLIKEMYKKTEEIFMISIVPTFTICLLAICISLFRGVQINVTHSEIGALAIYVLSLCLETFLYCWFGNHLQTKSEEIANAVYQSHWPTLTAKERKSYYFVMLMSSKEITMTYHGICHLSTQTFVSIIKMIYTIFNLLQTTTKT